MTSGPSARQALGLRGRPGIPWEQGWSWIGPRQVDGLVLSLGATARARLNLNAEQTQSGLRPRCSTGSRPGVTCWWEGAVGHDLEAAPREAHLSTSARCSW